MIRAVFDASALLAYLMDEAGWEFVDANLRGGLVSSVNLAEVLTRMAEEGQSMEAVETTLEFLAVTVRPFDAESARRTARLRARTRSAGLSLGDRACIALAQQENLPVMTADRAWAGLDLDVEVVLIR